MKPGGNPPEVPSRSLAIALATAAALALFSFLVVPWGGADHFFWSPWGFAAAIKSFALALLAGAVLWGVARGRRAARLAVLLPAALLLAAQCSLGLDAWAVLRDVPWGFDHPSFMFRVWEFGKLFPRALGGYLPLWNGGIEHFVGVTSGAHAFGVLLWPFLQFAEPHHFYGAAILAWFVFAAPWCVVFSLRGAGVAWGAACFAGFMSLGVSQEFFHWMWHFGTIGAMTSATMVPVTAALAWRIASGRGGWGTVPLLAVAAWLACLWTPCSLVPAALGAGWLLARPLWTRDRWLKLAAAALLCLALWGPWLWTVLHPCRNVVEYVNTDLARPPFLQMAWAGFASLGARIPMANPWLLALAVASMLGIAPRGMRRFLLPALLLLAAIAGWSREFKPLSQLDRMFIPLATLLAFPAAFAFDPLFRAAFPPAGAPPSPYPFRRFLACLALGFAVAGLFAEVRAIRVYYRNERPASLRTARDGGIAALADWLRANVPPDGRVAFAGRAVHAYAGGNTAYLPVLAGREMMGDDYYGFPRGTIEYNYPPRPYRARGEEGFREFSRAYGITHWIACRHRDLDRLRAMPSFVREAASFGLFVFKDGSSRPDCVEAVVFAVREPSPGRVLSGAAAVEADLNHLRVVPADPGGGEIVLRYNWRPGLVCETPGAAIRPVPFDDCITLVGVSPGGNPAVDIRYRAHADPVQPNFDGRFHH